MLTAMEDVLDSWPGSLLVVSHDRYLLERVTDQQYAILGGRLRHRPGGVDQYLRLVSERPSTGSGIDGKGSGIESGDKSPELVEGSSQLTSSARSRAIGKEIAAVERRMSRLHDQIGRLETEMADEMAHQDYVRLAAQGEQLNGLRSELGELEDRWLELSDLTSG
jgi:ATP-binding cassette subfamily F protein uup